MLTDFGIARILETDETTDLTSTSMGVGTPSYMAPEQVGRSVDQRADIYALGVVFYEMLTGRAPYRADTPLATLMMHASDPLPDPRKFAASLPAQAVNVLVKALQKKPANRYQSMGEFASALEKLAGSSAGDGNQQSKRWIGWAAGGLVVVALAVVGFNLLQGKADDAEPVSWQGEVSQEVGTQNENAATTAPVFDQRAALLLSSCGAPVEAILDEYNVVYQNDFSENSLGIEAWGADLSIKNGILVHQGHGEWKAAGRPDRFFSGKGYLVRYRMEKIGKYHIYVEQPGYGSASHRLWGITGSQRTIEPEVYFGANFDQGVVDWQQNDLIVDGQWLCVFIVLDGTTFTTKLWNAENPAQISVTKMDMGADWEGFGGSTAFAAEAGILEIDSYSEFAKK